MCAYFPFKLIVCTMHVHISVIVYTISYVPVYFASQFKLCYNFTKRIPHVKPNSQLTLYFPKMNTLVAKRMPFQFIIIYRCLLLTLLEKLDISIFLSHIFVFIYPYLQVIALYLLKALALQEYQQYTALQTNDPQIQID